MIDRSGEAPEANETGGESPGVPAWLLATISDLEELEFEAPLAGSVSADCQELSELFRGAAQPEDTRNAADTPATRVFNMLAAVTGMHFKPHERNEPFGPMMVLADGRRTAAPSDFRPKLDVLADMADRATNPVLRARLADVCWLLDRERGKLGSTAVSAYTEVVRKTERNEVRYRFATEGGALHHSAEQYLRRALQIGRAIGWDKPIPLSARELTAELRKQAIERRALVPIQWFCGLDLDFAVSDPGQVASDLNDVLAALSTDAKSHVTVDLWRLTARAYHLAKLNDERDRCRAEAAECLASQGFAQQHSAMMASHFLSAAIAELHGVPGKKDRRTELRHQLVDFQDRVPDELSVFSHPLDLREIAEKTKKEIGAGNLLDMLFMFADLAASPEPEELVKEAKDIIEQHPLSSLFATSHLDREGKVLHRSEAAGFRDTANDPAIQNKIAQAEGIRRQVQVSGAVEPARHAITGTQFVSDDLLQSLLQHSPFVPSDLVATFSRGFTRFFQGDFTSATYTLTPLLENSLRHVLKLSGHDTSIFDDATQVQEDRTISSLFEQMRSELDEVFGRPITTDIENVFLVKPGPHIRHRVAHGLFHDGDPYGADAIYGCWLIWRLCLVPLFPYRDQFALGFE